MLPRHPLAFVYFMHKINWKIYLYGIDFIKLNDIYKFSG